MNVYRVQMRAVNVWGTGDWSADTLGTTLPAVVPGAPAGLTAEVSGSEARVDLSWAMPTSTGGAPITGYRVESSVNASGPWVEVFTTTGGTTYTDDGTDGNGPMFAVGTTQYYRVGAVNSVGAGPTSNVALAYQSHGLGAFTSQGVQAHLSAPWNQAGFRGQGIKVGIIAIRFKRCVSGLPEPDGNRVAGNGKGQVLYRVRPIYLRRGHL